MGGRKAASLHTVIEPAGVFARRSTDILAIEDPDVATAVRFIREHACDRILVSDVVERVGVSHSTLKNHFKAAVGRTVHAEIQRVQLERARQLIADTDLPLKQVALQAGFQYVQYLTRLFHRRIGQTPAKFRSQRVQGPGFGR